LHVLRDQTLEDCRKRRYEAHFISKLSDAGSEAEETRVWLELPLSCGYLDQNYFAELDNVYDKILAQLAGMRFKSRDWLLR
jgi:four helix bundle protein